MFKIDSITCAHCEGTGTCKNENDESCFDCVVYYNRKLELHHNKVGKNYQLKTTPCAYCNGLGKNLFPKILYHKYKGI